MKLKSCPDCQGELEEGAAVDLTYGNVVIQRYGKAKLPDAKTKWLFTEVNFEDIRRIITYRCIKCNRLFPYAEDIVLGKNLSDSVKKNSSKIILFILGALVIWFIIAIVLYSFMESVKSSRKPTQPIQIMMETP